MAKRRSPAPPPAELDLDMFEIDTREVPRDQLSPELVHRAPKPCVPGLFPLRSVNLMIGSSTSGKTALALSCLETYIASGTFLDYAVKDGDEPHQCGAIVCSGNWDILFDRIAHMEMDELSNPIKFPVRDWDPGSSETPLETLQRLYGELCHQARQPVYFLFIEGLQYMMEGGGKINDSRAVRDFYYQTLQKFCIEHHVTILGTVGMAKMRKGESYPVLADRVFGSVAWSQEASTLIGIEHTRLDLPEEKRPRYRKVRIESKNKSISRLLYVDFDEQHRLVIMDPSTQNSDSPTFAALDNKLDKAKHGTEWGKDEFLAWADELGVVFRTVERWIASRASDDLGMLEKVGNTRTRKYRKPLQN